MCVHTHTYNTSDGLFVGQNKKVFVDISENAASGSF